MSEFITRTIYGSQLQTRKQLGIPFALVANTTLNEKFGIQSGIAPSSAAPPNMQYFAIGNGGHRLSVGAGGIAKTEPVQHESTDAALYNHLPFVLRDPSNDLTPAQRANYGLRGLVTINGRQYIAYYLRRLDLTGVDASMLYTSVTAGVSNTTNFVPTSSNLNPTPPALSSSGTNVVSGDYVSASAPITVSLTADDVSEILNVANVIYGDTAYAIISEIAFCSGQDKLVAVQDPGNAAFNFNEVVAVQVNSLINTFSALQFNNNGVEILLDMGATEPLFAIAPGTGVSGAGGSVSSVT